MIDECHRRIPKGRICPWVFHDTGRILLDELGKMHWKVREAWKAACEDVGVPGRIPHDFRRTAVRNLVRAGVSEDIAMKLTGHETRSVFDWYDVVDEEDLGDAVRELAEEAAEKLSEKPDRQRRTVNG